MKELYRKGAAKVLLHKGAPCFLDCDGGRWLCGRSFFDKMEPKYRNVIIWMFMELRSNFEEEDEK